MAHQTCSYINVTFTKLQQYQLWDQVQKTKYLLSKTVHRNILYSHLGLNTVLENQMFKPVCLQQAYLTECHVSVFCIWLISHGRILSYFQCLLCTLGQFLIWNTFFTTPEKSILNSTKKIEQLIINFYLYSAVVALVFLWTWTQIIKIPPSRFQRPWAALLKYRVSSQLPVDEFEMQWVFLNIPPSCSLGVLQYTLARQIPK